MDKNMQTAFLSAALAAAEVAEKHAPAARELLARAWLDEGGFMTAMVNVYMKKNVAKAIGAKGTGPVNACVAALTAAGVAKQADSSTIAFDPKVFGHGDWRSAASARIVRAFGPEEVSTTTEIDYGDGYAALEGSPAYDALGADEADGSDPTDDADDANEADDADDE